MNGYNKNSVKIIDKECSSAYTKVGWWCDEAVSRKLNNGNCWFQVQLLMIDTNENAISFIFLSGIWEMTLELFQAFIFLPLKNKTMMQLNRYTTV